MLFSCFGSLFRVVLSSLFFWRSSNYHVSTAFSLCCSQRVPSRTNTISVKTTPLYSASGSVQQQRHRGPSWTSKRQRVVLHSVTTKLSSLSSFSSAASPAIVPDQVNNSSSNWLSSADPSNELNGFYYASPADELQRELAELDAKMGELEDYLNQDEELERELAEVSAMVAELEAYIEEEEEEQQHSMGSDKTSGSWSQSQHQQDLMEAYERAKASMELILNIRRDLEALKYTTAADDDHENNNNNIRNDDDDKSLKKSDFDDEDVWDVDELDNSSNNNVEDDGAYVGDFLGSLDNEISFKNGQQKVNWVDVPDDDDDYEEPTTNFKNKNLLEGYNNQYNDKNSDYNKMFPPHPPLAPPSRAILRQSVLESSYIAESDNDVSWWTGITTTGHDDYEDDYDYDDYSYEYDSYKSDDEDENDVSSLPFFIKSRDTESLAASSSSLSMNAKLDEYRGLTEDIDPTMNGNAASSEILSVQEDVLKAKTPALGNRFPSLPCLPSLGKVPFLTLLSETEKNPMIRMTNYLRSNPLGRAMERRQKSQLREQPLPNLSTDPPLQDAEIEPIDTKIEGPPTAVERRQKSQLREQPLPNLSTDQPVQAAEIKPIDSKIEESPTTVERHQKSQLREQPLPNLSTDPPLQDAEIEPIDSKIEEPPTAARPFDFFKQPQNATATSDVDEQTGEIEKIEANESQLRQQQKVSAHILETMITAVHLKSEAANKAIVAVATGDAANSRSSPPLFRSTSYTSPLGRLPKQWEQLQSYVAEQKNQEQRLNEQEARQRARASEQTCIEGRGPMTPEEKSSKLWRPLSYPSPIVYSASGEATAIPTADAASLDFNTNSHDAPVTQHIDVESQQVQGQIQANVKKISSSKNNNPPLWRPISNPSLVTADPNGDMAPGNTAGKISNDFMDGSQTMSIVKNTGNPPQPLGDSKSKSSSDLPPNDGRVSQNYGTGASAPSDPRLLPKAGLDSSQDVSPLLTSETVPSYEVGVASPVKNPQPFPILETNWESNQESSPTTKSSLVSSLMSDATGMSRMQQRNVLQVDRQAFSSDADSSDYSRNQYSDTGTNHVPRETPAPITVQGDSVKTVRFTTSLIDRVRLCLRNANRPLRALIQLWQGPDNVPQQILVTSENGGEHPFSAIIETPGFNNALAIRNVGSVAFPFTATVEAELEDIVSWDSIPMAMNSQPFLAARNRLARSTTAIKQFIQGGAVRSVRLDDEVTSAQILLTTDGRCLSATVEILYGPNNSKQIMDVYSDDGELRPLFITIDAPPGGSMVYIYNKATIAFPLFAHVEAYTTSVDSGSHQSSRRPDAQEVSLLSPAHIGSLVPAQATNLF
ncbi:hypothetical protein ACA910_004076 [Epithemia clementina (nom. ined.)]